jgi:HPt (histidine-containing phosphotransfer) domain-containing protein
LVKIVLTIRRRDDYLQQLAERKEKIRHFIALLEQNALRPEDRAELQSQAHKFSGTGKTYGFPNLSEAGYALDDWMSDHPENSEDLLKLTRNLLAACQDVLQSGSLEP